MTQFVGLALAGLRVLFVLRGTLAQDIQGILTKADIDQSRPIETNHYDYEHNFSLHFDDVPTDAQTGAGTISTYAYLNFTGFEPINTPTALSHGFLDIYDADCAFSLPNALFNVRSPDNQSTATRPLWLANVEKLHAAGFSEFFNLKGLSFKPLGDIPRGLILEIVAWEIRDSAAQNMYTAWVAFQQAGYQKMDYYDLTRIRENWGRRVNLVEVKAWAPGGDEEVDGWPFCIDDLEIEFVDLDAGV
ncbi:hypothetical protein BDV12DRAFT_181525, partial [Aspergillus spectabilis]